MVHAYKEWFKAWSKEHFFNQAARAAESKEDEDHSINEKWAKEKKTLVSTFGRLSDGAILRVNILI